MTAINQRELTIIRRYFIKQDYAPKGLHKGDVVLIVRNDAGKEYEVILRRNKAHSCNCAAGQHSRKCYHVDTCVTVENNRWYAARMAKIHAQERAEIDAVVEAAKALESSKIVDISTKGALNGNRGFQLMKVS